MQVTKAVKESLNDVYVSISNRRHLEFLGDMLSEIGMAEIITSYLRFLETCKLDLDHVWRCYTNVGSVCWNFSDRSVALCKAFAKAGLLEICVQTIRRISTSYKTKPVNLNAS